MSLKCPVVKERISGIYFHGSDTDFSLPVFKDIFLYIFQFFPWFTSTLVLCATEIGFPWFTNIPPLYFVP